MSREVLNITIVLFVIVADYVTGVVKACYQNDYKSCVMREGLYHKSAEILALALMYYLQYALPIVGITVNFPFVSFITYYIVLMEISSIIENIGEINPSLIGPLADVFSKVKEAKEKKEGDDNGNIKK